MEQQDPEEEIPILSQAEAIAEVRRWLEVEHVDPARIFSAAGDHVIRYGDLIGHLEQETSDGKLLRFAISRGRLMRNERRGTLQNLLHIASHPPTEGSGPSKPPSTDDTESSA
jgi:hypothetical protein